MWSSANADWATPPSLYRRLHEEFWFVLDVAASASTCVTPNWYGPDHPAVRRRDGLACDWVADADGGAVWCNPPYGAGIANWTAKAHETAQAGVVVVCLVPARVDTRWFHDHCIDYEVRFLKGRLRFNGAAKDAPFPSCVVVMDVTAIRHCARCGERLHGRRDARYCSGACRMAAHRAATRP